MALLELFAVFSLNIRISLFLWRSAHPTGTLQAYRLLVAGLSAFGLTDPSTNHGYQPAPSPFYSFSYLAEALSILKIQSPEPLQLGVFARRLFRD